MAITSSFVHMQGILLAKIEETYASDPTPTVAANAVEALDVSVSYPQEVLERNLVREDISQSQPGVGKQLAEIQITCELKNGGTAGTANQLSPLLQACGMKETDNGSTDVRYSPASSDLKSCYIYFYQVNNTSGGNYKLHKFAGCVGNLEINAEAGQKATISFSLKAKYVKPSDVSDPGDPTYESTIAPTVASATVTIDAISDLCVALVNLNLGNEVSERMDMTDATSLKGFKITGRKPTMAMNPETVLIADQDFEGDMTAGTEIAIVLQAGSAANRWRLSGTQVSLDNMSLSERNGLSVTDIACHLNAASGDDEFGLLFD